MDSILRKVGDYGWHQRVFLLTVVQPTWMLLGAQTLFLVFLTQPLTRVCDNPKNLSSIACKDKDKLPYDDCDSPSRLTGPVHRSIAGTWDLFHCSNPHEAWWNVELSSSVFFFGFLLGVLFLGALADRRGRKPTSLLSLVIMQIGAIGSTFAGSYLVFLIARLALGIGVGGVGLAVYLLCCEIVTSPNRVYVTILAHCSFSVGTCAIALLGAYVPNWRYLSLLMTFCGFGLLYQYTSKSIFLESPRWLSSQKKWKNLEGVLHSIANRNGAPTEVKSEISVATLPKMASDSPSPRLEKRMSDVETDILSTSAETDMSTLPQITTARVDCFPEDRFADIFLSRTLRFRLIIMLLLWFASSVVYYGLSLAAGRLTGSGTVVLATFLNGLLEIIAIIIGILATELPFLGRKKITAFTIIVASVLCYACAQTSLPSVEVALAIAGRFCIAITFVTVYLYGAELFPSSIRSSAVGMMSMSARIGGIVAPQIVATGKTWHALPNMIFAASALIAGIGCLFLPESLGMPMYDSIAKMEAATGTNWIPTSTRLGRNYISVDVSYSSFDDGLSGAPTEETSLYQNVETRDSNGGQAASLRTGDHLRRHA